MITRSPLTATLIAAAIAVVLLVTVVLPAEHNIDWLGTGELLGLTGLAEETRQGVVEEPLPFATDTRAFVLAPFESVEIKYHLGEGSTLLFSWSSTTSVAYDFHGEPEGGPKGFAETHTRGSGTEGNGAALIPFRGIHGWYFENRTFTEAVVTLKVAGHFDKAFLFQGGFVEEILFGGQNVKSDQSSSSM